MPKRVVVRAPATIANIGAGFDCVGVALAWHNLIEVSILEEGSTEVVATGEGATELPRDETNLIARAASRAFGSPVGFRISCTNAIPLGRGLGSSAAAVVAGLAAGTALASGLEDARSLLPLASELEGHADNVAPCLLGGITVASADHALRFEPPEALRVFVCVAPKAMSTVAARAALPSELSFPEAVEAVRRASLLVGALATGQASALMEATDDRLHQPARFELMPESAALVKALRGEGIPAFLAGAGPSVAAIVSAARSQAVHNVLRHHAPAEWRVRPAAFDLDGVTIVQAS
jgi:homoserine kinase